MTEQDSSSGQEGATHAMSLEINGSAHDLSVRDDELLVSTLRERLGLRAVRATCGIGICGTCTVQVEGEVVSSCLLLTRQVEGREVRTSEGLVSADGQLSKVQQAFMDNRAYQCSYCIPGMVVTVDACLSAHPDATFEEVRDYLAGNLCRCGTYVSILEAVRELVAERRAAVGAPSADEANPPPS